MSLVKSLQTFLETYDGMEIKPISGIKTDATSESFSDYALAPAGNGKTFTDIVGNRRYENNYVFYAKEAVADEVNRADNYDFLENFSEWLEEQGEASTYPTLPDGYEVLDLEVSNAMLFEIEESGAGLYQVQLKLIFMKRR